MSKEQTTEIKHYSLETVLVSIEHSPWQVLLDKLFTEAS